MAGSHFDSPAALPYPDTRLVANVMARGEIGFDEARNRLLRVRRRLNYCALQHVLYLAVSLAALTCAGLILLAIRASSDLFGYALWLAVPALALGAVFAGARLYRRWLSPDQVARLIDRRTGLDDRLATLLAYGKEPVVPAFVAVLSTQLAELERRWEMSVVAPRRIPRSAYLCLAALGAFAAAALLEGRHTRRMAVNGGLPTSDRHFLAAESADGEADTITQVFAGSADDPAVSDPPISDHGLGAAGAMQGDEPANGLPAHGSGTKGGHSSQTHDGTHEQPQPWGGLLPEAGRDGDGRTVADRLQDLIRQSFGAERVASAQTGEDSGSRGGTESFHDRSSKASGEAARRDGAPPPEGERADTERGAGGEQPFEDSKGGTGHRAGSLHAGGGPGGKGAGNVFGRAGNPLPASPEPRTFPLKLAESLGLPGSMEPQPRAGAGSVPARGAAASAGQAKGLKHRELEDAPLHRAEIPPEHEDLVRSIFSLQPAEIPERKP